MRKIIKDIKLLNKSIEHHKRMQAFDTIEQFTDGEEAPFGGQCALCDEYPNCIGCPVEIKTGKDTCQDTPYNKLYSSYWAIRHTSSLDKLSDFKDIEQEEIAFLTKLRDELEGKK